MLTPLFTVALLTGGAAFVVTIISQALKAYNLRALVVNVLAWVTTACLWIALAITTGGIFFQTIATAVAFIALAFIWILNAWMSKAGL